LESMLFFYSEVIDRWAVLVDLGEAANPLILEENWCLYFLGFCRRISGPAWTVEASLLGRFLPIVGNYSNRVESLHFVTFVTLFKSGFCFLKCENKWACPDSNRGLSRFCHC